MTFPSAFLGLLFFNTITTIVAQVAPNNIALDYQTSDLVTIELYKENNDYLEITLHLNAIPKLAVIAHATCKIALYRSTGAIRAFDLVLTDTAPNLLVWDNRIKKSWRKHGVQGVVRVAPKCAALRYEIAGSGGFGLSDEGPRPKVKADEKPQTPPDGWIAPTSPTSMRSLLLMLNAQYTRFGTPTPEEIDGYDRTPIVTEESGEKPIPKKSPEP